MEKLLAQIEKADGAPRYELLEQLVRKIRPGTFRRNRVAAERIQKLTALLNKNSAWRDGLRKLLIALFTKTDTLSLFSEAGILSNEGFFSEAFRKVAESFLPPAPAPGEFRYILNAIFNKKNDYKWIQQLPGETVSELLDAIFSGNSGADEREAVLNLVNAIEVLTHRVTGIGLDPSIIMRYPDLNKSDSPFFRQHNGILQLLNEIHRQPDYAIPQERLEQITTLIDESESVIKKVRKDQHVKGASLSLTYLSQRMYDHTQRIKVLLKIVYELQTAQRWTSLIFFFKKIALAESKKNSLKEHFTKNIGFLAYQVTEHAGRTGEHYITHDRKGYKKMLFSSMGGGFIVGFLSCFKTAIYYMKQAPLVEAFLYSMNYSFGFIAIHLTGSTLATKQPAMTAAKIASSLDIKGSEEEAIKNLSEFIVKIFRSQFIAFVGNMFIAFPVALIAGLIYFKMYGAPLAGEDKAWKMIEEIHPWRSLSLFHAGIAGVCLFFAGLISGYYDNEVVFRKIPERLNNHPLLKVMMPGFILRRFSKYIEKNLGSLSGNFFLGIFLGTIGTIGFMFGLPIDIRHITFASGNFGLAYATLGLSISFSTIIITIIGIIGIGFVNFIVSFSLALWIAIRSRGISFDKTPLLLSYIIRHLLTNPKDFFIPPKVVASIAEQDENL